MKRWTKATGRPKSEKARQRVSTLAQGDLKRKRGPTSRDLGIHVAFGFSLPVFICFTILPFPSTSSPSLSLGVFGAVVCPSALVLVSPGHLYLLYSLPAVLQAYPLTSCEPAMFRAPSLVGRLSHPTQHSSAWPGIPTLTLLCDLVTFRLHDILAVLILRAPGL